MSTFKLPVEVFSNLDYIVRHFWWGTKPEKKRILMLKSWDSICAPKEFGGLGFRKFQDMSNALLAKLAWSLARGERNLWTNLMRAKYLKNISFFDYNLKGEESMVWRSIIKARDMLARGTCFKVGNDNSIPPWKDPWIPWITGFKPKLKEGVDGSTWNSVAALKLSDGSGWDIQLLQDICEQDSVTAIERVMCSVEAREDKLCWLGNDRGLFSVKDCYLTEMRSRLINDADPIWKKLWKSVLHERLKLHLWRMLANVIPTRQIIWQRVRSGDKGCFCCEAEIEMAIHIFKDCPLVRSLAFGSVWGCRLHELEFSSIYQLIEMCLNPPQRLMQLEWAKNDMLTFFATLFCKVWCFRNKKFHEGTCNPGRAILEFNIAVGESTSCRLGSSSDTSNVIEAVVKCEPPDHGWLKINVDAGTKPYGCAISMVVRNEVGDLVFLMTKVLESEWWSPFDAEVEAIAWALEYAASCGWTNVLFEMDAKEVVEAALMDGDPENWFSIDNLIAIRRRFSNLSRKLTWRPREANSAADAAAKYSLSNNVFLFVDEFSVDELPISISVCLSRDKFVSGL